MLDQITKIVEQIGTKEASGNGISADKLSSVTSATKDSIVGGIKNAVSGGNMSQITDLFKGDSSTNSLNANPLVSGMVTDLVSNLTSKVGLNQTASEGFAKSVIPQVLGGLISNSKGSGFNVSDLLSNLGGGSSSDLLGKLGGMLGGGKTSGKDLGSTLKGFFK